MKQNVSFEPASLVKESNLCASLLEFQKTLESKTSGFSDVSTMEHQCSIHERTDGRGVARVFLFKFNSRVRDNIVSWNIKVYSGEGAKEKYTHEVNIVLGCLALLDTDLFAIRMVPLGEKHAHWGIAYSDTDFAANEEMISFLDWLRAPSTLLIDGSVEKLINGLTSAVKALHSISTSQFKTWDYVLTKFSSKWIPHYSFGQAHIEKSDEILAAIIDGVRPSFNIEAVTSNIIDDLSLSPPQNKRFFKTAPLLIDSVKNNVLRLNDLGVTLEVSNAETSLPDQSAKRAVVFWRSDGPEVTSRYSAVNELIGYCGEDLQALSVSDILFKDAEIHSLLKGRSAQWGGVHGDFHAGNIRVTKGDLLGKMKIIDFSDLAEGPIHTDLARLEMSIWLDAAPGHGIGFSEACELLNLLSHPADVTSISEPGNGHNSLGGQKIYEVIRCIRQAALKANLSIDQLHHSEDYLITLSLTAPIGLKWAIRNCKNIHNVDERARVAGCALALAYASTQFMRSLSTPSQNTPIDQETLSLASVNSAMPPSTNKNEVIKTDDAVNQHTVQDLWTSAMTRRRIPDATGRKLIDYFKEQHPSLQNAPLLPLQEIVYQQKPFFKSTNIIIGGPTSSGKTFIAGMFLISQAFVSGRKSIYVSPTRALAQVQYRKLQSMVPAGYWREQIILSTSEDNEDDQSLYNGDFSIACMVYEKANIVFSSSGLPPQDVGILVIDELHMMEDLHRGTVLELLVSKIKQARNELISDDETSLPRIMIISTERSVEDTTLQQWLKDDTEGELSLISVDSRPIPVIHHLVLPSSDKGSSDAYDLEVITKVSSNKDLIIPEERIDEIDQKVVEKKVNENRSATGGTKPNRRARHESHDLVFSLIKSLIERKEANTSLRLLVFGPSKSELVNLGSRVSKYLKGKKYRFTPPSQLKKEIDSAEPTYAVRQLKRLISSGIYLHHSDIPPTIRREIEEHFDLILDDNSIELLLATSTLSYGVNLAIDSVILIQHMFPRSKRDGSVTEQTLPVHEFQNMLGRAGRFNKTKLPFGAAYIVCSLHSVDPIKDIIERYYRIEGDAVETSQQFRSRLLDGKDLTTAKELLQNGAIHSQAVDMVSTGKFSYPFIRAVLDGLRHVSLVGDGQSGAASLESDVEKFFEHTYFWSLEQSEQKRALLKVAVNKVLADCARNQINIVKIFEDDQGGQPRYQLTELGAAVIDTGTDLNTLLPMLNWVAFMKQDIAPVQEQLSNLPTEGDSLLPKHPSIPVELFIFGLFLVPEVWRTAREFAPEGRRGADFNDIAIKLNRSDLKKLLIEQLKGLDINSPEQMVDKIEQYILKRAPTLLGGPVAYEGAHVDIAFRLYIATCRWIAGRPIEDVEQLAQANSTLKGLADRIRPTVERMSWLAIALYRCINDSVKGVTGILTDQQQEKPLLMLSRRLRYGCVTEALPLINRPQSRMQRHHVASLVADKLTMDRLLSLQPQQAVKHMEASLGTLRVSREQITNLLWDLINLSLRSERDLKEEITLKSESEEKREDIKRIWDELYKDSVALIKSGKEVSEDIISSLTNALRLVDNLHSKSQTLDGKSRATIKYRNSFIEIGRRDKNITTKIEVRFVRPQIHLSGEKLPPSVLIPKETLITTADSLLQAHYAFVVGLPWFLPNNVQELREILSQHGNLNRCFLITPSGLMCIIALLIRQILLIEDFDETLRRFPRGVHILSVSDIVSKFPMPQLSVPLREAMQSSFQVTLRNASL